MNKRQKSILIIFLLFFIYYVVIKHFTLYLKEGNTNCEKTINNKCKYYDNSFNLCKGELKGCKTEYCLNDFIKPEKEICEYSQCLRPYGKEEKGCVSAKKNNENIYTKKNPCMEIDFCKNCKRCYDERSNDHKNDKRILKEDGNFFDCKKCLHNGKKKPPKPSETKETKCGFLCEMDSYFGWITKK